MESETEKTNAFHMKELSFSQNKKKRDVLEGIQGSHKVQINQVAW